jgi:nicotinamidase-related amidase
MRDALLLVDVIQQFRHTDGERLLASYRERLPGLLAALESARAHRIPVIYANDNEGMWDGDSPALTRRAIEEGRGGDLVARIRPQPGEHFVIKPRYSAFDATPLELILRDLEVERILLAGAAMEMCVAQTAIQARELGFKVSVLADACATTDPELEQVALTYLERVAGAVVDRGQGGPAGPSGGSSRASV